MLLVVSFCERQDKIHKFLESDTWGRSPFYQRKRSYRKKGNMKKDHLKATDVSLEKMLKREVPFFFLY